MNCKIVSIIILSIFVNIKISEIQAHEIDDLTQIFLNNLIEDNRDIANSELTSEIKQEIDRKIESFLSTISQINENHETPETVYEGKQRVQRSSENDILMQEKPHEVFALKGFRRSGGVPVNFPIDICLMNVNGTYFAAALHEDRNKERIKSKQKLFKVLRIYVRKDHKFSSFYDYHSVHITKIDCQSTKEAGYVGFVSSLDDDGIKNDINRFLDVSSAVIKVVDVNNTKIMQRFGGVMQTGVKLWSTENNMYLIFTHKNVNASNRCSLYKLFGSHFDEIDVIPCENAQSVEFFEMFHNLYLFVGNSPTKIGQINTKSYILKYDWNEKKFLTYQRISTNTVLDCKYFYLDNQPMRQHYLVMINLNEETTILFYKFVNEFFIPIQTIPRNDVSKVLPVTNDKQFYMLISSDKQDVQIYEHNGWKFVESSIDFTGEVFSKGVSSMRVYKNIIPGKTTIVIANQEVSGNLSNIYTPEFIQQNNTSDFQNNLKEWCSDAYEKIQNFDVEKTNERLGQSLLIMNEDSEEANFYGKLYLKNTKIDLVETPILKSPSYVVNNQSVERIQQISARLENLNKKLSSINKKLKILKLQSNNRVKRDIADDAMVFNDLVVEDILMVQKINGHPIQDLIYKDQSRNQITGIKANEVSVKKSLSVKEKIGGISFSKQNLVFDNEDQEFLEASVPQMAVNNMVCGSKINAVPITDFFNTLSRKFSVKLSNPLNELITQELFIEKIDNTDLQKVMENALQNHGDQVITGNLEIEKLKTKQVIFENTEPALSNELLSNLVLVTNPKEFFKISQDVRFSEELTVNKLYVRNTINNIKVKNGNLQVLKKNSAQPQIVTGEKFFDSVLLKGPINLQGKIKSQTLEKMNPIATINKNLVLPGDYKIKGNVTIKRQLVGNSKISSKNQNLSLNKLWEHGLQIRNTPEINTKLIFKQPVSVKNNLDATSINGLNVANFVKTNNKNIQVISGKKKFAKDLIVIGGSCEANVINGIDISNLNLTVLKHTSNGPQIVNGSIEFNSIRVPSFITPGKNNEVITCGDKTFNNFIGLDQDLILNQVSFKVPNKQIRAKNLNVKNCTQKENSKIFNKDLNFIIKDSVIAGKSIEDVMSKKTFGNLVVDQFLFEENNPLKNVVNNFDKLERKDLNYTGNLDVSNVVFVKNLYLKGNINGIKYEDLRKALMIEYDQVFTAPQTFGSITTESIHLTSDSLNGANLSDLKKKAIWLNENEILGDVESTGELVLMKGIKAPIINGYPNIEDKILLHNSDEIQHIKKVVIRNTCELNHLEYNNLNGIDINNIKMLMDDSKLPERPNLLIKENCQFKIPSNFNSLNEFNLQNLFENVWLGNRDTILTGSKMFFQNFTKFENYVVSQFINGFDLGKIQKSYISLSRPQQISSILKISGTGIFKKLLQTERMVVKAKLKSNIRDPGFNITYFNQNVFKKNVDQEITGNWQFERVNVDGSLEVPFINNLTLQNDVLKVEFLDSVVVTGYKQFSYLQALNIQVDVINQIDLADWYFGAVKLNEENQTILGKVKLYKPLFYNDIKVKGLVNEHEFNNQTIMTKSMTDQVIRGDLTIKTIFPEQKAIFSSSFDRMYLSNSINDINLKEFYENSLKATDQSIDTKLIFKNPLKIQDLETNGNNIYDVNMETFLNEMDISTKLQNYEKNLIFLNELGENLIGSFEDRAFVLSHFELYQSLLCHNILNITSFTYDRDDKSKEYLLVVYEEHLSKPSAKISFFKWEPSERQFVQKSLFETKRFDLKTQKVTHFENIEHDNIQYLYLEVLEIEKKLYNQNLLKFDIVNLKWVPVHQFSSDYSRRFVSLKILNDTCLGSFSNERPNIIAHCDSRNEIVAVETHPNKMISTLNHLLISLTDDQNIQIWNNNQLVQSIQVPNPVYFDSVYYADKYYLAVCSNHMDQSVHHGSIEIYESFDGFNFVAVQTIFVKVPAKIQFATLPNGDLMLYILTNNPTQPILIYGYNGITHFVEILSTTLNLKAIDLTYIEIYNEIGFLAVVVKPNEIRLIEAVLQKY